MRAVRIAVCIFLISASAPADALAQIRSVRPITPAPSFLSVTGAGLSSSDPSPLPLMPLPSASLELQPALQAAVSPAKINSPTVAQAVQPLSARVEAAQALAQAIPDVPVAAAPEAAARSFALLVGEAPARADEALPVLAAPSISESPALPPSAPRAPDPETSKNVRRMMLGTAVMKSGMETITLSVPLLALTAFGGITAVAGLVVIYGLSQAVFAGMAGGLADRFTARKVLAGAVAVEAGLVATVIGAGAAGVLTMGTLLPLYLLIGGVTGIIETTRHSIPALLLGQDEAALKEYNAKLHISYETAGVAGALAAGALIALFGPLWSLAIQPPAFALAAWHFWRVRHAVPAIEPSASDGVGAKIAAYIRDIKAGAKLVLGDVRMRWVALAFVLPQIVHRVLEGLLIPVFAKKVLENPSASAWLLTASNAGELAGAALLLALASRFPGSRGWIQYGALGMLLIWALAFSHALPLLLAMILFCSLSWAASDLSLRSEVQRSVSQQDQPRAISFLYGAQVIGTAAASLGLGALLDALAVPQALIWVCGAFSILAVLVFLAAGRIKR